MRQRQTASEVKASEGLVVSGYQAEEWSIGRMYKLTAQLLHRPNHLMTRPGTPAIAAEVAAPMRKLWVLSSEARYPAWESRWLRNLWQAERDRGVPSRKQKSGVVHGSMLGSPLTYLLMVR